jgi:3,5-epimerase/4-reductase
MAAAVQEEKYLLFGKNGWICGQLEELLKKSGKTYTVSSNRLENRESLIKELDEYKPTHVLNAAGVTGRPNVDWCEDHKQETIRANVIGALNIADLCYLKNIHLTVFATGCIFEYDEKHPLGGAGFKEEDKANFFASFYSKTKGVVEELTVNYPNVLILRVRMPISDDLSGRNFITKISKYAKVVDIPNSMTVLTELLPASLLLAHKKITGVMNFTNPGVISHNQILALYKEYIDPEFKWENFSEAEQAKILKAGRSNNCLDASRLVEACKPEMDIQDIQTAMVGVFQRMKVNLGK